MRRFGWLALLLVGAALLAGYLWRRPAPLRPLPAGIPQPSWPGDPNLQRDALQERGADAVPALLADLQRRHWGEMRLMIWLRSRVPSSWAAYLPDAGTASYSRSIALWGLGELGPAASQAVASLVRFRDQSQDPSERSAATIALAKIQPNDPVARSNFLVLLASGQQTERYYGAMEFGALPVTSAVELTPLLSALHDSDGEVRANAAISVARFGPLARDAVPLLRELLTNHYRHVSASAAYALVSVSPEDAGEALMAMTNAIEQRRDFAELMAPKFFRAAGTSVRAAVPYLESRAAAGNTWAIAAVCRADPNPTPEAIDRLARLLGRNIDRFGGYGLNGEFDLPELVLLGQWGPLASNAVPHLQRLERHLPSKRYRQAVQEALARITNAPVESVR